MGSRGAGMGIQIATSNFAGGMFGAQSILKIDKPIFSMQ